MQAQATSQETTQYLTFYIGDEEYGLGILEAREIIQYPPITRVPAMPAAIRGVMNLRGSVVPVVDLATFFNFPERPQSKWTCVVIVERTRVGTGERDLVGIVVDSVSQVIELGPGDIEPPLEFGTRVGQQFLRGMGKAGRGFVLLLDLERLLVDLDLDPSAVADADAGAADAHDEDSFVLAHAGAEGSDRTFEPVESPA